MDQYRDILPRVVSAKDKTFQGQIELELDPKPAIWVTLMNGDTMAFSIILYPDGTYVIGGES